MKIKKRKLELSKQEERGHIAARGCDAIEMSNISEIQPLASTKSAMFDEVTSRMRSAVRCTASTGGWHTCWTRKTRTTCVCSGTWKGRPGRRTVSTVAPRSCGKHLVAYRHISSTRTTGACTSRHSVRRRFMGGSTCRP